MRLVAPRNVDVHRNDVSAGDVDRVVPILGNVVGLISELAAGQAGK